MASRITVPILALLAVGLTTGAALADPTDALIAEVEAMAKNDALPARPLVDKIHEGRAKGVPPQRIRPAVMALHARLLDARALCGTEVDVLCIQAGADALASGLEPTALLDLVRPAAGAPARVRIFVALTGLRARGVTAEASIDQVSVALREGRLDRLLPTLDAPSARTPPAVGRGGDLPVQNPTRDRDQTGKGKAWGRGEEKPGRPDAPDRPESSGQSGEAPGQK